MMRQDALAEDDRREFVRRRWYSGVPLHSIKRQAGLSALGGRDVMEVVRAAGCSDRHPTTREVFPFAEAPAGQGETVAVP
jgi:hypothetical protein